MVNKVKPSFIKKIEIDNLWDSLDLRWDLQQDVNILSGSNGSGKSTILSLVFAILKIGEIPKEIANVDRVKVIFDNGEFIFYERLKVSGAIRSLENKAKKDHRFNKILTDIKNEEGKNYKKIKSIHVEAGFTSFDNFSLDLNDFNNEVDINAISTFDNPIKKSNEIDKMSNSEVRTDLDWEIDRLQKRYLDYKLNISKRKDFIVENNDSDQIKKDISELNKPHYSFLNIIDSLFECTGKVINRDENEVSFLFNSISISPFMLSSGEKQILIILLTVLLQDNSKSILFMDEPEISLHIDWQRNLIKYIKELNPHVQLIIATHSPGIVMDGWVDKTIEIKDIVVNES